MEITTLPISSSATNAPLDKAHSGLKKATQQFESYFLDSMLKEMRKTVPKDTLLKDDGHEKEIFTEMMDQHVADSISQQRDFGLSSMMYQQLSKSLPTPIGTPEKNSNNTGDPVFLPNVEVDIRR